MYLYRRKPTTNFFGCHRFSEEKVTIFFGHETKHNFFIRISTICFAKVSLSNNNYSCRIINHSTCERYTHKTPLLTLPAVICLSLLLHLSLVHPVILPTHSRWLKSRQTSSDRHLSLSCQHGSGARRLAAPGADS